MAKFLAQRLIQMFVIFLVFLTVLFFLLDAAPGNITDQLIGNPDIPPEARVQLAQTLGLDKPLWERYVIYITNFFRGDLGFSFQQYPRDVSDIIVERLPRTVFLFLISTLASYWIGFNVGKFLAWRRGKASEHGVNIVGVSLYTVFQPWFYLMMIFVFSFLLGWFPAGKFINVSLWRGAPFSANSVFLRLLASIVIAALATAAVLVLAKRQRTNRARKGVFWGGVAAVLAALFGYWIASPMTVYAWDIVYHTILPVITLALVVFGGVMLIMRSSMLETMREDYVFTARAKGVPDHLVRDRHAARNALLPLVTSLIIALAFVIGGGIIIENIFSWPGIGNTLLQASVSSDIPLAMGAFAFIGVLALVGHLVVDIVYMYLDPRIRY